MIYLNPAAGTPIIRPAAARTPYAISPASSLSNITPIRIRFANFVPHGAGTKLVFSPESPLISTPEKQPAKWTSIFHTTAKDAQFPGSPKCFYARREAQVLVFPHQYPPPEAPNTSPVLVNDKYAYPYSVDPQEENFLNRPSIRISIPDHLKNILVDDWENVTKSLTLVPLPSKMPANFIIDTYFDEEKSNRRLGSAEADLLEEFCAGLKVYFDKAIGKILLYRFERRQLAEVGVSIANSALYIANSALSTGPPPLGVWKPSRVDKSRSRRLLRSRTPRSFARNHARTCGTDQYGRPIGRKTP